MSHPNKVKGNVLEQTVAKDLRDKYPFCKTARQTSRLLDDCKIDLTGLPLLIQCKAGYNKSRPKFEVLYLEMKALIEKNFPKTHPVHNLPYVLINKLNRTKGGKQSQPEMNQVTISYDFFKILIQNYVTTDAEI
jgi:hypothetical protein